MKKKLIWALGLLAGITACQAEGLQDPVNQEPNPVVSPKPSVSSSIPIVLSSVEASASIGPEPRPIPTPSPFPAERLGRTYYTPRFPCREIQAVQLSNPVLTEPQDIAVTQEGKEIYVTLKNSASFLQIDSKNRPVPVERSYLYRIRFDKPGEPDVSVVNTNQSHDFTCGFNGEIEMTPDQRLLLSYPEMETQIKPLSKQAPIIAQYFYLLDLEHDRTQILMRRHIPFNPFAYEYQGARQLSSLHLSENGNVYYLLLEPIVGGEHHFERWLAESDRFESLVKMRSYRRPLSVREKNKNRVTLYNKDFIPPFGQEILDHNDFLLDVSHVKCSKIDTSTRDYIQYKGNVKSDGQGNYFFAGEVLSTQASFIWKHTPDNQITCFAGNGKNSYQDAKGLQASFNQPSELDIDAQGNIYVADTGNHAIRKITPEGTVTTLYKRGQ